MQALGLAGVIATVVLSWPDVNLILLGIPLLRGAAVGIQLGIILLLVVGTKFLPRFTHLPEKAQPVEV